MAVYARFQWANTCMWLEEGIYSQSPEEGKACVREKWPRVNMVNSDQSSKDVPFLDATEGYVTNSADSWMETQNCGALWFQLYRVGQLLLPMIIR